MMKQQLCFVMAQLDFLVGDIEGNAIKIIEHAIQVKQDWKADLIIFPELALTGYPPEDLLFKDDLYERINNIMGSIKETSLKQDIDILMGLPIKEKSQHFNAAILISQGETLGTYYKTCLPNYSVFDEARYFKKGNKPLVIEYRGLSLGILICEDLWYPEPLNETVRAGANLVISLNASPFDMHKHESRTAMLHNRAKEASTPILYVNCVGCQDELIFDGGSLVLDHNGIIDQRGPFYSESLIPVHLCIDTARKKIELSPQPVLPILSHEARIYGALVLGVRDYVEKNHFHGALLGLSGGIDSALTLAIAVDALGPDRVEAVLMPSRYTASMSIEDANEQAHKMGVKTTMIPIEKIYTTFLDSLEEEFKGFPPNVAEENLQARCRGTLLMAISNKTGALVLATGNKSEISVGYCTLYGDMVGGFGVLKDVPKTLVYKLSEYRNSISSVIPSRVMTREPTAELAPNQRDQDSLPPYPILDKILELYIEKDKGFLEIVREGFDPKTVKKVILMVDRNEYKRRQAPIGVRITQRAFGRDRRYPITSGYNHYLRYIQD